MMKQSTFKSWASFSLMCAALLLMTAFAACSKDSSVEDIPDNPETPIDPGDWQAVSVAGGTIEKGDIALTFPAGTFAKDEKVAITEVKKGDIAGEHEASQFYQVSMPCTAGKPLTLKVKSAELEGDIAFVAYTTALCTSSGKETKAELIYNTTYADDGYTTVIPAINGDVEDGKVTFTIGLGKMISYPAETRSPFDQVVQEGKVNNITYKVRFPWWTLCTYSNAMLDKVDAKSLTIAKYVEEALGEIDKLGFKVREEPTLYIDFAGGDDWGGHQVCGVPGSDGWSTWVSLGIGKLLAADTTEADIRCTVIHEILHWFQALAYDPRSNFKQANKKYSGEELVMYEMGAVWSEQFMNGGKMNTKWVSNYLPEFLRSGKDAKTAGVPYDQFGYGMSVLLYYITNSSMIKKEKVVDMFDIWNQAGMTSKSYEPFKQWLTQNNCKIYEDGKYFNFVYKLFSGKVLEDNEYINPGKLAQAVIHNFAIKDDNELKKQYECRAYGISAMRFVADRYKNAKGENSFEGKEIVFKQTDPDVVTFVAACATDEETDFKVFDKKILPGDSLVINGEEAEALFKTGTPYSFIVVSVNSTDVNKKSTISCQVRSIEAQTIERILFDGNINCPRTYVTIKDVTKQDYNQFYMHGDLKPANNTKITASVSGSTLHVRAVGTDVEPNAAAPYLKANYNISFDVENFTPAYKNCKITNLKIKYTEKGDRTYDDGMNYKWTEERELNAASLDVNINKIWYIPNGTSDIIFEGTVKEKKLKIESAKYSDEHQYTVTAGELDRNTIVKEWGAYVDDYSTNSSSSSNLYFRIWFKDPKMND
jgi:hypothetical protein